LAAEVALSRRAKNDIRIAARWRCVLTEAAAIEFHSTVTALETAQDRALERERLLALGAALLTVTLWASAFVGIRAAGRDLSPGALALGRLLVASVALGAFALIRRDGLPARGNLGGIALCGILWFGLYSVVLNEAERTVDAGTAAMLVNVGPILIAALAGLLLGEGFPRTLLIGCAIAFGGAVVIGIATSKSIVPSWGAFLCVVAALAYAGGVVAQKPLLARVTPLQVTWLACTFAALACLPFAGSLWREASDAGAGAIGWTIYLGLAPTGIGFIAWAYALSRTTAGRMGSTTYLVTSIAILLGWLLLDETPPALALLGGALCLAGVVVARSARTPSPR
jgi:drug/metabolite transporter (DMT)-like permease